MSEFRPERSVSQAEKEHKKEMSQEDLQAVVSEFFDLIQKKGALVGFIQRGRIGQPHRGDDPDSFIIMSNIRSGGMLIGLGKEGARYVGYSSSHMRPKHENENEMIPIDVDQEKAASLMRRVEPYLK